MDAGDGTFDPSSPVNSALKYANPISATWNSAENRFEIGIPYLKLSPKIRITTMKEGKQVKVGVGSYKNPFLIVVVNDGINERSLS